MNILIKLMSVVSLVLAPWFARLHADADQISAVTEGFRRLLAALLA
jgi:hypothetical protein